MKAGPDVTVKRAKLCNEITEMESYKNEHSSLQVPDRVRQRERSWVKEGQKIVFYTLL
jgi:hypothetical protein